MVVIRNGSTFAFLKEVGILNARLIWVYDIGAFVVNHKIIGMMLAALLVFLMKFLEIIHDFISQEFKRQVRTEQSHRPSLLVMNRHGIGGQLATATDIGNEIILR